MIKQLRIWSVRYPLRLFFVFSFGWAWGVWLSVGWLAPHALPVATLPGAWAPTLAALLVTGLAEGRQGVRQLLVRLLRWRVGLAWYGVIALGLAGTALAARGLYAALGGAVPPMTLPPKVPPQAWPVAVPMIFVINLLVGGPLAEELGWRGFALDKLRLRYSTLTAALLVGAVWAAWHLPFYWLGEASVVGGLPFGWFVPVTLAWSVLMAWAYVNTQSLLLPVLVHAGVNTLLGTLGLLGTSGNALGLAALYAGANWLAVAIIVAVFGRDLVRRGAAPRALGPDAAVRTASGS
jgi:membrane protease YdiL (CAAX protease family)